MAHRTDRSVGAAVPGALKQRAAANGGSADAEHREAPRATRRKTNDNFAARAEALRQRLRSSVDSTDIIRAARDGAP